MSATKPRQQLTLILLVLAVGGLILAAYIKLHQSAKTTSAPTDNSFHPKADTQSATTPPSDSPAPSNNNTNQVIPPSSQPQSSASHQTVISAPTQGSRIDSGTTVSGQANSGKLYYRVKGKQSGQIASGALEVPAGTGLQPFSFQLAFTNQAIAGDTGVLEVYNLASDGSEANVASVAVSF